MNQSSHDLKNNNYMQRLVISKMIINNFKSYAGRQEIGPFHKVTGIKLILVVLFGCRT